MRLHLLTLFMAITFSAVAQDSNIEDLGVKHHYLNNEGTKIHFVEMGKGPLVILLHGFPDFWYSWHPVMKRLSSNYKVVALDLRGYNRSDAPEEIPLYQMAHLKTDVIKIIEYFNEQKATIIGHDWGAAIGWQLAIFNTSYVTRYIALSLPHIRGTAEALRASTQNSGTNYTANFFREGFENNITVGWFLRWGVDSTLHKYYRQAFKRSQPRAMLNYYKANMTPPDQLKKAETEVPSYPQLNLPVLIIQGGQDPFISAAGLNNNWNYNDGMTSIHVLPHGKHFLHHEDPKLITKLIVNWLKITE